MTWQRPPADDDDPDEPLPAVTRAGRRVPNIGDTATPDPDEPVQRWEVTGCECCGRTIWRPYGRREPADWRHVNGLENCREGWRP